MEGKDIFIIKEAMGKIQKIVGTLQAEEKEETARANIVKKQRNKNTSSQKTIFSFLKTVRRP